MVNVILIHLIRAGAARDTSGIKSGVSLDCRLTHYLLVDFDDQI